MNETIIPVVQPISGRVEKLTDPELLAPIKKREAKFRQLVDDQVAIGKTDFSLADNANQLSIAAEYALSLPSIFRSEAFEGMNVTAILQSLVGGDTAEAGKIMGDDLIRWAALSTDIREAFEEACNEAGLGDPDESELNRRLFDAGEARSINSSK